MKGAELQMLLFACYIDWFEV